MLANYVRMIPDDALIKSGMAFAMSNNKRLFAYLPESGEVTIDMSCLEGVPSFRWFNPLKWVFHP